MFEDVKPSAQASTEILVQNATEQISSLLIDDNFPANQSSEVHVAILEQPVVEPIKVEIGEVKVEVVENKPKMTEDQLLKEEYLAELEAADIKDPLLLQGLKSMMEMGYLNYKLNYSVLLRSNKDLVVAMNNLCNNMVSDSMFQWLTFVIYI